MGRGGISALAAHGDTVWAGTLFDSLMADNQSRQIGSGLSWSTDAGASWQRLSNEALFDTLIPVNNACFGLAVEGDTVWAAFFAGSSMRSTDFGRTWEQVPPGGADRVWYNNRAERMRVDSLKEVGATEAAIARAQAEADSIGVLTRLHRTFSVAAYGDTVWIGTGMGVASSFDFGDTWTVHQRDSEGLPGQISGHWGVAVKRQIRPDGQSVIWVGADVTDAPYGQVRAINRTEDNGATWTFSGPTFAWDFAFAADSVWAGSNEGLFLSPDHGESWIEVQVQDMRNQDLLLRPPFVGIERFPLPDGQIALWAGADNGLGRSLDGGLTWTVLSFPVRVPAIDSGEMIGEGGLVDNQGVKTYAAPNPFAPSREPCRVVYGLAEADEVSVSIYDFSSRKVRTLVDAESRPGGHHHGEFWDGLDDAGNQVANGVYFFRVETAGGSRAFGKVVVLD